VARTFATKATDVCRTGAAAVVIFSNQPGAISGTLGNSPSRDAPVTSVSGTVDEQRAATPGLCCA
jgi:hypothetical protein